MKIHEPGNLLLYKITEPELCKITPLHKYTKIMGPLAWQGVDAKN